MFEVYMFSLINQLYTLIFYLRKLFLCKLFCKKYKLLRISSILRNNSYVLFMKKYDIHKIYDYKLSNAERLIQISNIVTSLSSIEPLNSCYQNNSLIISSSYSSTSSLQTYKKIHNKYF